jgi:uncharacterized membrane protein
MKFGFERINTLNKIRAAINGNISILAIVLILLFAFMFLAVSDLCRIFVARESAKKAADAVALSIAQNLLFFDNVECYEIAEKIAEKNYSRLCDLQVSYDEVIVTVERDLKFVLIARFFPDGCRIIVRSKTKVVYPWDDYFGLCNSYRFSY